MTNCNTSIYLALELFIETYITIKYGDIRNMHFKHLVEYFLVRWQHCETKLLDRQRRNLGRAPNRRNSTWFPAMTGSRLHTYITTHRRVKDHTDRLSGNML